MHERYFNRKLYFDEQSHTTRRFVIPYIEQVKKIDAGSRVLEIGCGEGGNLLPFAQMQCECVGVDLDAGRIQIAGEIFREIPGIRMPKFIYKNIYNTVAEETGTFDIIMMRDVIEHIPDQEKFMGFVKRFLKEDGVIFFGFPPWQMPFGGHQQISGIKWIRHAPFLHLLPMRLYRYMLKKSGESEHNISEFTDIKKTGISIERFERAVVQAGYQFRLKTPYFINPNYEIKFKIKTRGKIPVLGDIPVLRNFVTTCLYAVISRKPASG